MSNDSKMLSRQAAKDLKVSNRVLKILLAQPLNEFRKVRVVIAARKVGV